MMNKLSRQDRREWLIFTIFLLIGIFLLQFVANIAVAVPPNWRVQSNMDSKLNPDKDFNIQLNSSIEEILPEIITPPAWEVSSLLTVEPFEYHNLAVVPMDNFFQTPTPTAIKDWQEIKVALSGFTTQTNNPNMNNQIANLQPTSQPSTITQSQNPTATSGPAKVSNPTSTQTNQIPTKTNTSPPQLTPTNTPTTTPVISAGSQPTTTPSPTLGSKPTKAPRATKEPKPTKSTSPGKNR